MERKEAAALIRKRLAFATKYAGQAETDEYVTAMKMAVEALKQPEPRRDMVNRKDVLSMVCYEMCDYGSPEHCDGKRASCYKAEAVDRLPPAT